MVLADETPGVAIYATEHDLLYFKEYSLLHRVQKTC